MQERDDIDDLAQFAASTKGRRESVIEPFKSDLLRLRNEYKCSISDMHDYLKLKGLTISYEGLRKYVNAHIPLISKPGMNVSSGLVAKEKSMVSSTSSNQKKDLIDSSGTELNDENDSPPGLISSRAVLEKKADVYVKPNNSIINNIVNKSSEKKT